MKKVIGAISGSFILLFYLLLLLACLASDNIAKMFHHFFRFGRGKG